MIGSDLPVELRKLVDDIRKVAENYGLDPFETVFEMVDYEQMNGLASLGGFPVRYPHWRFGMDYDQMSKSYEWGLSKIYEMVINTDPSYAYLLKGNRMVDQKIVIAHVYGHVDFFKNNYWFSKTNRKMLDTMANYAVRIRKYMDRYGQTTVEDFIDQCLALENLIDPFLPFVDQKPKKDPETEGVSPGSKLKVERSYMEGFINPAKTEKQKKEDEELANKAQNFPVSPERDVLQFLLKYAPLKDWEHDVLAIIRNESYYFAPQAMTKILNEGWASYWHSRMMTEKVLKDDEIVDFADAHAGVLATQPGQLNPYKLGIELLRDVENRWNKGQFGKDFDECTDIIQKESWNKELNVGRKKIFEIRRVCNDITFIDQYMTREFAERLKLFTFDYNRRSNQFEIADREFNKVKQKLLFQLTNRGQPVIIVKDGNYQNRGELLLKHEHQGMDLDLKYANQTMKCLEEIWKRPVNVETLMDGQKKILTHAKGEFSEKFV